MVFKAAHITHPAGDTVKNRNIARDFCDHWETWTWVAILALVNWPLIHGQARAGLIFVPDHVLAGQWWRIMTFPLVHLSWYHLLLDAGGFLVVSRGLEEKRISIRLLYMAAGTAGSLLLALALEPSVRVRGLCGLSGIAHGLMAVSALEMLRHRGSRGWGWFLLILVSLKSALEACCGHVLFEFMHMGLCGRPVAACHAGGVIGAILAYGLVHGLRPQSAQMAEGRKGTKANAAAPGL